MNISELKARFKSVSKIKKGGQKIVFRAVDALGETVALKIIGNAADPRVLQEIDIVKELELPNVPRIIESGIVTDVTISEDALYIVEQFIAGISLRDWLNAGNMADIAMAYREIIAIIADLMGIVFVWWSPDSLQWYWKLLITAILLIVAVVFMILSKQRPSAKLTNYSWEDGKPILLLSRKNKHYRPDMLVSIYRREELQSNLCAIGYVTRDPKSEALHVQVVHQIDEKIMQKIRNSSKQYKQYFIEPYVEQKYISAINWQ